MKFNPNISVNDLEEFMESTNIDSNAYTDTYKTLVTYILKIVCLMI